VVDVASVQRAFSIDLCRDVFSFSSCPTGCSFVLSGSCPLIISFVLRVDVGSSSFMSTDTNSFP
jgi:hypothetical protein